MITQEKLREWVDYNPLTGVFTAIRNSRQNVRIAGDICGCLDKSKGYMQFSVDGEKNLSHRFAAIYMGVNIEGKEIDHINHIKHDNRWSNLRVVDHVSNQRNRPLFKNNKSGVIGVSFIAREKMWYASIQVNKKSINLGSYADKKDAIEARRNAEARYGFHSNHGKIAHAGGG
jgi:hypothetical protein